MIEKFTPEELRQIKKELGLNVELIRKEGTLKDEKAAIEKIMEEKPFKKDKLYKCITQIADIALNNAYIVGTNGSFRISGYIPEEDYLEYRQILGEIISIVEKHNRKYKG